MRANCISPPGFGPNNPIPYFGDRQLLLGTIRAYVEQNGLTNTHYSHEKTALGIRAAARGTKQINGRWVTYEAIWYVSPRSVMAVTIGHLSNHYPTAAITSFLSSVSLKSHVNIIPPEISSFITTRLPFGVSIDVPRDWWVLNETMNNLIRTSRDAILDFRGIAVGSDEEIVLIAANSWPPTTYAALRVTRVRPPLGNPDDIRHLSQEDLLEMRAANEAEMKQTLPLQGLQYLKTLSIKIEDIDGWPAVVFSYLRSGPNGPVIVYLIQIGRISDYLRINLSYRQSEKAMWMPVIERIKRSIRAR